MHIIPLYRYKNEQGNGTIVSDIKPDCSYEPMWRLISNDENCLLTNFIEYYDYCIDIEARDLELWHEVHKDDLNAPIPQLEQVTMTMQTFTKIAKLVANQVTDDVVALEIKEFYDKWAVGTNYTLNQYITHHQVLYKVLSTHTSQVGWEPDKAPSLFAKVLTDPTGETILDWVQPDATNAYMKGNKVKFEGNIYESLIDNNVWSPATYPAGWRQIEE